MATFELSSKKYKNGRRPFTAVLYELQPPECVVDDVGTKYNKNGITFLEEFCAPRLDSIKDMSVTVEFLDEERTQINNHGLTGMVDGMPQFNNATVVGHFTDGFVTDIEVNNVVKHVVAGKGYLDEMRYPAFVSKLETELQNGNSIEGSIEIYKSEGNEAIVYKKGFLDKGRIPTEFIHSGWSMVLNPADSTSTLVELNTKNNKEDVEKMEFDMNEVRSAIKETMVEINNKNETEYVLKIEELNSQLVEKDNLIAVKESEICEKDEKISELNATVEQVQKALDDLKKEHQSYWAEREALEKELGELKAKARLGELNSAIECFSEEERKFAEAEINSFNEAPLNGDIDAIVSKIYVGIGQASKKAFEDAKIAEQNSAVEVNVEDIFSEICEEVHTEEKEDLNIF